MWFGVLIVGGGSGGCVVAGRLRENPGITVGVIEAGGPATDPDIAIPQRGRMLAGRDYDWAYRTVPQPGTAGRVHDWPRGRVIGGSSCLHAMAHVRGAKDDFRAWAEISGASRWSYEGLLPAFRRTENFSGGASAQHGAGGPLPVLLPDAELSPVVRAYMAAGLAAGIPLLGDHNTGRLMRVAPNPPPIRAGRRVTGADAYLEPVLARRNLTVVSGTMVHRLTLSGARVTGVTAEIDGQLGTIEAGTTILCAGAVASPLLLIRPGTRPPRRAAAAGCAARSG